MPRISETNSTNLYNAGTNAGCIGTKPTFTDNNDGTYDIGAFEVLLYDNSNHEGQLKRYLFAADAGRSIADTPDEIRYLVVNYNSGTPILQDLTYAQLSQINESSVVPVFTMYNESNTHIHHVDWDTLGQGLPNMIHKRLVKTDRFRRESGVALSVTDPAMSVQITAGQVWLGAVENALDAFNSATATHRWYHWHHSGVNLTINITTVGGGGEVTAAAINTAGTGYMAGMDIAVLGGTGTGFVVTIDTVNAVTGAVTAISISSAGTGYLATDDNLSVYQGWMRMVWENGSGVYNSSRYDGGSAVGVLPLTNNYYTVNWIYRDLEGDPHAGYVLGGNYQTFAEALSSQPRTDLPIEFAVMSTLVGRIIVQQGDTVATSASSLVESAYETHYSGQPVSFHNDLGGLQGGVSGVYYHSDQGTNKTDTPLFTGLVLPKTAGTGIQVDLTTPTFGWRDLEGVEYADLGGATGATLSVYHAPLREYSFSTGDRMDVRFHVPHDYVPNTDMYLHVHWSHNGTAISGTFTATLDYSYAKGHNQENFSAPKQVSVTYPTVNIATTPQYRHRIEEVIFTTPTPGGTATLLDNALLEVDGLILVGLTVTAKPTITGGVVDPFIHRVDIHYQSSNLATKQKAPPFFV